jgi:hypothetical protein
VDIDFHYYATYKAARLANFSKEESQKIAYAAQFVDEFDYMCGYGGNPWIFRHNDNLPEPKVGSLRFESQTAGTFSKIGSSGDRRIIPRKTVQNTIADFSLTTHCRKDIWIPYHFLPGNFKLTGVKNHSKFIERKGAPQILCRPFSATAIAMINEMREAWHGPWVADADYRLHLLGLRMHVFVDTWAHQDFAGVNESNINNCEGYYNFVLHPEGHLEQVNWSILSKSFEYAPTSQNLGHGRLGHFPDYGFATYYYTPAWLSKSPTGNNSNLLMLARNNPKEFETAFFEMVRALHAIKINRPYGDGTPQLDSLAPINEAVLRKEFEKTILINKDRETGEDKGVMAMLKEYGSSDVFALSISSWKRFGKDIDGFRLDEPKDFDIMDWKGAARNKQPKKENTLPGSDLYNFNLASEHHWFWARSFLNDNNIVEIRPWDAQSKPRLKKNVAWIPDAARSKCVAQTCGVQFGFRTRKHHCRGCGDIFCDKCAPVHPEVEERLCRNCLENNQAVIKWVNDTRAYLSR